MTHLVWCVLLPQDLLRFIVEQGMSLFKVGAWLTPVGHPPSIFDDPQFTAAWAV